MRIGSIYFWRDFGMISFIIFLLNVICADAGFCKSCCCLFSLFWLLLLLLLLFLVCRSLLLLFALVSLDDSGGGASSGLYMLLTQEVSAWCSQQWSGTLKSNRVLV